MKCPNCNKEVSPEFNVCPWCEYKPKKCQKPECQDVWLPTEARFCPRCGEPLSDEKARETETRENNEYPNENLEFDVEGVSFNMVYVKGGTFLMGSDICTDARPLHRVTLSDYYISETVVTLTQIRAILGDILTDYEGSLPFSTSWEDCQFILAHLNIKTGKTFRLPTEAEWEYAARGGHRSQGFKYAGSNDVDKVAWYNNNSGSKNHPVKQKAANELGLYDMSGNVWEWCQDYYENYSSSAQTNPIGTTVSDGRVARGGCYCDGMEDCCVASRSAFQPDAYQDFFGFRLVLCKIDN